MQSREVRKFVARGFVSVVSTSVAALTEIVLFHPLDTVIKRVQADRSPCHELCSWNLYQTSNDVGSSLPALKYRMHHTKQQEKQKQLEKSQRLSDIIFRDAIGRSPLHRYLSLFPGFSFAVAYKLLQRVNKFSGQAMIRHGVQSVVHSVLEPRHGVKAAKICSEAFAGALSGAFEVSLLPLDSLKIRRQASLSGMEPVTLMGILYGEGFKGLYRGAGWAIARNVPGSLALFGVSSFVREKLFGHGPRHSVYQDLITSFCGSVACMLISAPMDTLKTRAQVNGNASLKEFVREEGIAALWKGCTMKILFSAPKLVFTYTFSHWLSGKAAKYIASL